MLPLIITFGTLLCTVALLERPSAIPQDFIGSEYNLVFLLVVLYTFFRSSLIQSLISRIA